MSTDRTVPDRLTPEALLAGLAARAGELSQEAHNLRESYRFSRILKVTVGIGVLLLGLNAVLLALLLSVAHTNRHNTAASQQNTAAIRDCTTPDGRCYQRGQQATANAIAQIVAGVNAHTNLVLLATLDCSRPRMSNPQMAACLKSKGIR